MRDPWTTRWRRRLGRPLAAALRGWRYRRALRRGEAAGEITYQLSPRRPPAGGVVVWLAAATTRDDAVAWCRRQTLPELAAAALDAGEELWRVTAEGPVEAATGADPGAFYAPGELPELDPGHLETCWLVLAAEEVDAVVLLAAADPEPAAADDLGRRPWRRLSLFSAAAWRYDAATGTIVPRGGRGRRVKVLGHGAATEVPRHRHTWGRRRRGPYLASDPLPPRAAIGLRDAALLDRAARPTGKPAVLVLTSFLARGGAEHTLYETLAVLRHRFELAIVTLAPHHPERGDRRDDFRALVPRIVCLGDVVHPDAMPGMLAALLDAMGAEILYNANGTTLFYDFAPRLKARRPGLRIVDHLYDHRVGYIERYTDAALLDAVDACVAENRRIAERLAGELGWPAWRVPVIHPCGRPQGAFPTDPAATRRRLRRELGISEDAVVLLTAARMHPQKRPLDLVALAERLAGTSPAVELLIVGGGELEEAVDRAIAAAGGAPVRRLPFRTDIPDLIAAADAGCLVSDYEGLPVFLLECLQAGRPFLGTDVGDMGELLRASGAGLVVDRPGDIAALADAAGRLLDPELRGEMARQARDAAAEHDVETCAGRYADVLLGRGDAAPEA